MYKVMDLGQSSAGILSPENIAWEILLEPAERRQAEVNDHLDIRDFRGVEFDKKLHDKVMITLPSW